MKKSLYIPGLGDQRTVDMQRRWIRFVNIFRRKKIHFFDPHWEAGGGETDEVRYTRLQKLCIENPGLKSVWGASAGGSLAVRIGVELDLEMHLICAKAQGAAELGADYEERAPHFKESVEKSEAAIASSNYDASKVTAYIPKGRDNDGVIKVVDMVPKNAATKNLPRRLDHVSAIAYALIRRVTFA